MDTLESKSGGSNTGISGFFSYVFKFDSETKSELMNIIQYAVLALIPIVILNKIMQKIIPEADEQKGSIELVIEIVGQLITIILGIFFVNRLITYIPTYSGIKYLEFSITQFTLATMLILLSLQTKLGDKVSIIYDRVSELWNGPKEGMEDGNGKKSDGKKKGTVKVSQPISGQGGGQGGGGQGYGGPELNSLYGGGTPISQLPNSTTSTQQLPDYNAMYNKSDQNPLIGASTPGDGMIMAANEVLGGSAFGSNF
jgi:hypothetical protein